MSSLQRALWIDRKTIVLPSTAVAPGQNCELIYSSQMPSILLDGTGKPGEFELPAGIDLATVLKGQLRVRCGTFISGIQIGRVLDELFYFEGKLGAQFNGGLISVSVWAPTAQMVKLMLYQQPHDSEPTLALPMSERRGVWSAEIDGSWRNQYYLFSVTVYVPKSQAVVENLVTDPYSVDLALNGVKSRLTDLDDAATKPEGWDGHASPELRCLNDLSIWELHVRDFSVGDLSVGAERRGTYMAFTEADSNGVRHLRRLVNAGMKAVHLLPTFHFASVDEDKSKWKVTGDLSLFPPDGKQQQEAVSAIQGQDGFNWGYDPVHYMAPEGSYAVNANDRVKEYRAMVQALHSLGMRVIQDQVFNHTSANGQAVNSVLDKIVPDYYYRLDADGHVKNATCCSDTASERRMMEKLMVDTVRQSAVQYKIDGFRFDLMGFHYVANMQKIQAAVGKAVYLYGEGWKCEDTAGDKNRPNATQANLTGTGIGTYNDLMRDAIRGGGPFSGMRQQGFATGAPKDLSSASAIRASLIGAPGYAASPIECVNYCSVHDNQILFDAIQLKAPAGEDAATRAKRQVLALSLVALGQGVPFFHAGDELLRSKDMDNNSYNSGDWFNKLDFTYRSNHWGVGLPVASENEENWAIMQPLLANPKLRPSGAEIVKIRDAFEALLRVRYSSELFRMRTAYEIERNLVFIESEPGAIAMVLKANVGSYEGHQHVLVVFNGTPVETRVRSAMMRPHPAMVDCGSYDSGAVRVDGLMTGVFVTA